jgi:hypothetical protein
MTPVKIGTSWRIKMADESLVGWYMSKTQAEAGINKRIREGK